MSHKPQGVSPTGTFAGIATSGRVIMSGGKTGLGILERAVANMPVLLLTWEGGPPTDIDFKVYKVPGCPPPNDAEYLRQQCEDVWEHDAQSETESKEPFASRAEWFDPQEEGDLNCYARYH